MAHLFHIRPWEWELLTLGEINGLCLAIDQARAEAKKNG